MFDNMKLEESTFKPSAEDEAEVQRFIDDCLYIEESVEKRGLPSLIVYIIWLKWSKYMAPTRRFTFSEFNVVLSKFLFNHHPFRDTTGIAAWMGVDLTQLAHLYFKTSKLGRAFEEMSEEEDDTPKG